MTEDTTPATPPKRRKKLKPEHLLFLAFAVLMVVAIAGMMVIEQLGEEKMGDSTRIHDAADR